jgi:hypothetical protein
VRESYYECLRCGDLWTEARLREEGTWGKWGVACGDADCGGVVKVRGPFGRIGGEGSDRQIAAMQHSFQQRFVTSGEIDDVRHKHGHAFEDAIKGGEVGRIKKRLAKTKN